MSGERSARVNMPQLDGGGGDELGANDELIPFKDEGEREDKSSEDASAERDLDDVKSSLVHESENISGSSSSSDSEQQQRRRTERRASPPADLQSFEKAREFFAEAFRRQQDGGFFKSPHYPGYPFLMIPDLSGPYLSSGALSPGARAYLQMKWPLLDVPGTAALKDPRSASPGTLSNKVAVVQRAHLHHHPLTPLITYSNERFSPATPPAHLSPEILDPKTGIPRTPHPAELSPYYPLSPGAVGQMPHPLGWLVPQPAQHMYPLATGGFRPPYSALAMSSLVSSGFSPHLAPPPAPPPPPHALHQTGMPRPAIVKQEPRGDLSAAPHTKSPGPSRREEDRKPHIKKPLNAFMLYMKEMRAKVVEECTLKESAAINQILGRRWHSLSREEQAKYYELARKERQLHSQLYPGWSARDNYGKKKKRKRDNKTDSTPEDFSVQSKKACAQLLPQDSPSSAHSSMLDSPATPTAALASPSAPAPTHSEQAQPLSLTTKPTSRPRLAPPSRFHHALLQAQPLPLVTKSAD